VAVETHLVRRAAMRVTVDDVGRTRVKDRYVISAPLAGNLARIERNPGDAVEPGNLVARIMPVAPALLDARTRAEAEARVAAAAAAQMQAQAALERAKLAAAHARGDFEQNAKLSKTGAVSPDALEHARFEERLRAEEQASAEFAVRVANHEVSIARSTLGRFSSRGGDEFDVTSPVEGRVLKIFQRSAGVVQAGTPLLEIGDPAALEIVSDVLTSDAVNIRHDAPVIIERWGDAPLSGHVRLVEPSAFTRLSALGVEEQRVNVVIDLDAPREKWARLGDGYRVETRIVVWAADAVLAVPSGAAFRHGEGWAVFAVSGGRAMLRQVQIGQRSDSEVQILSGLDEGAAVVLHPSDRVSDGTRIVAR
jgi:HlyD family secretion protein